jgi:ABC-type branched-subunit amino acid transport system substrate-binding protein
VAARTAAGRAAAAGPAVIKLGGVFPLSGPLGVVGTAMMEGVQSILTEVNARGGVNGSTLSLVVADDQFDPVRGKAVIQKLIEQDKVFAFAGIFSPFTTQAALPVIRAAGVPVVSPSGSDDREFHEPMLFPVTNPCGRQMAGNVQHLVQDKKLTKLAVVYLNVEAVSNCTKQFTAVAEQLGADVVFSGATAPAAPDCASRVVAARASGAQALIVITDNLGTVKCLQARQQQGWDVPVSISYNNTDDPTILRALGPAAEGLLSSSPFTGAASPAFAQQCGAIRTYYPDSKVQFFSLVGCLGTKLLVAGLTAAGADRTALIKTLESGRTFSFGDLVPPLSYGPGRHLPYDLTATVEVRDGRWVRTGPLYTPAGAR